jgi:hypothetical protein
VLFVLPASASATVTMTDFKVEPSSKQGGGHPSVTITQSFSYDNTTDSVKDAFVRLQPGLLGNPQSAAFCSQQQFQADSCPADSVVGSVAIDALAYALPLLPGVPTTSHGTVYNLKPTGDEPARLGIVVDAAEGLQKLFLQAPVYVRPGADGYGLESTFADQPRSAGLPVQITQIALTFDAKGSKGDFMRMPTSCAEGTSVSRANSWEAAGTFSQREFKMTPTGCESLKFAPTAEGSFGAPGITGIGMFPPISTTLKFDPEDAALKRAEVILPQAVQPNLPGAQRACSREAADASNCPDSSRVGTATIDSPLQPAPVRGPVYVAFNTPAALPGLIVMLPAPVSVRLDAVVEPIVVGTRNTFASNPDLPVRSFTLAFEGERPDAALTLVQDLCAEGTDRTMSVKLVAHNGKQAEFEQELATPGCDPRARVSIRRKGFKASLVARLKAAPKGPGITSFALKLPKTLRRGKVRPFVLADGARMRPLTRKRLASMPFPREVRTATVVWRGLRASRKLKRTTRVRLTVDDARNHTTTLNPRVQVRGKRPARRR